MILSKQYYGEYHGHKTIHLEEIVSKLREQDLSREIVWLAGDSSLDNKYWFTNSCTHKNGYETIIEGRGKPDICYHLNNEAVKDGLTLAAVNCAVEATRLESRACGFLLPQDKIINQYIDINDTLVVSIGGNDIALLPAPCTILAMLSLLCCNSSDCIDKYSCGSDIPCDDYACGFCTSALSCFCAFPIGMGYFIHLFKTRIQTYIKTILGTKKPKKVIVCMIYYPEERESGSWADNVLNLLGYNKEPRKLQSVIKRMFELATKEIKIEGTNVIPLPLFDVLDSKDSNDYCQRVEPSPIGGKKIAKAILDIVKEKTSSSSIFYDSSK